MEKDFQKPVFSRALMTAVFVGIFGTVLTLLYDLIFVKTYEFPLSVIINVATLIFSVNLLFFFIGFIYYVFIRAFKKGDLFFIILSLLTTAFLVWKATGIDRTDDPTLNVQFRFLLSGIIIIVGILASLAIPFCFHSKEFEKHVL